MMKMKKALPLLMVLVLAFTLGGCGLRGGNIDNVTINDWKPSEIYSDAEIEAAFKAVKDYFHAEFDGCTLTKLNYPGDTYADEFNRWAEQYGADEAIVILSNFDVDASGGDGSLNPNSTYENWSWVFIRNDGGDWEHATHGY